MRYLSVCVTLVFTLFLTSCTQSPRADRLAYQNSKLYVEAVFSSDEETFPVTMEIEAPEYDEDGRMLARDAKISFSEGSIISGISFELVGTEAYVCSGVLKIPIEEQTVISGIRDMLSLFCISPEHYYSTERIKNQGLECERIMYVNGDNSVEVIIDLSCMLPTDITAQVEGRTMSAHISMIRSE